MPEARLPPSPNPSNALRPGEDAAAEMVSLYQAQKKIHVRAVSGWFATWRWTLVWLTQLIFYGLPWLGWHERQAVLFDLGSRRFYIFNLVLYPQDFIYLTGLLLVSAYALFLFTAVAGRLWCGYACPQTVYTEIFMWVEQRFEGDRAARIRLDASAWTLNKLARKAGKQSAWLAIALWTGFTFVGYFTPIRVLGQEALGMMGLMQGTAASQGFGAWEWFWVLFYGFATYGNAGYMREQVCKYMCPYARFQSAMFDKDTLVISYDAERGEPRGSRGRKADPAQLGLGSCIDCTLCVQVCPTGIDIRKGLQYECIGCAACIDVCDSVMDKMNYPRGLVRYDTQHGLDRHLTRGQLLRRMLRPRVLIYSAVLVLISGALLASLLLRTTFRVDVVRDRSSLARLVDDGYVENVYRLQIMNATESIQRFTVAVEGLDAIVLDKALDMEVAPAESRWVTASVRVPPETAARAGAGAHAIDFQVRRAATGSVEAVTVVEKSTFVVPR